MMQKTIFGALFLLFLALSCEKTDSTLYFENKVHVRAVPDNQRVKLYFSLCNPSLYPGLGVPGEYCEIIQEAIFDVYQLHPDGTEMAKLATGVADTFWVEGLPNGVNAYFQIKAWVGRTYVGSSTVVVTTPDVFTVTEYPAADQMTTYYHYYSPDFSKIIWPPRGYIIPELTLIRFPADSTKLIRMKSYPIRWDATSRFIMGVTTIAFSGEVPALYDSARDTLIAFPGINASQNRFRSPFLADDQRHFYYLHNNGDGFGLWKAPVDGSTSQRVAPDFTFHYNVGSYLNDQQKLHISGSPEGNRIYASFYTFLGNPEDGLYQIDPVSGSVKQLLDQTWLVEKALCSPDNRRLLFLASKSGEREFWLYDLEKENFRQITNFAQIRRGFILPESVYWQHNNYIYVPFRASGVTKYYKIDIKT